MKTKCTLHTVEVNTKTGTLYCPNCKEQLTQEEATAILSEILNNWSSVEFVLKTLNMTGMLLKATTEKDKKYIKKQMYELQKNYLRNNK